MRSPTDRRRSSPIQGGSVGELALRSRWRTNIEITLRPGSLPRSGFALQPNVAASAATLGMGNKKDTTSFGVETDWNSIPRVAAAATLGWRLQPLRGTRSEFL